MPKKDDEKIEFIPIDDAYVAEWMKNPKIAEAYDALEDEFAEVYRKIRVKKARRAWRKAQVKRVRTFWASLMRGIGRIAY